MLAQHRFVYPTPIGPLLATHNGSALCSLQFTHTLPPDYMPHRSATTPIEAQVRRWLDDYFAGLQPTSAPPLAMVGTRFQTQVWQQLLQIPFGQTTTYAALARNVGCTSARAVGGAVARNPVAIIVPCHRVVATNSSLTGYAYGIDRKHWLLQHEGAQLRLPLASL